MYKMGYKKSIFTINCTLAGSQSQGLKLSCHHTQGIQSVFYRNTTLVISLLISMSNIFSTLKSVTQQSGK